MGLTQITTGGVDDNINIDSNTLKVDGTNNRVGIGTSSPSKKLHIVPSGSNAYDAVQIGDGLYLGNTSNNNNAALFHQGGGADLEIGSQQHITFTTGDIAGSATERVRIDSSGNVGIGRTSASSKLDIQAASGRTQITLRNVGNTSDASTFVAAEEMTSGNADLILAARHSVRFFSNLNEKMRIDSSGNVLIGSSAVQAHPNMDDLQLGDGTGNRGLTISSSTSGYGTLAFGDSADGSGTDRYSGSIEYYHADNSMRFYANTGERMRIDSSGRLLINHTADIAPEGYASKLQLCDTSYQGSSLVLRRDQNTTSGPTLLFAKSRSSSKGGNTIVNSGDDCGTIRWFGNDGGDINSEVARIRAEVDGTPGGNDMPGRLVFSTTADGASSPTERMRIGTNGLVATHMSSTSGLILGTAGNATNYTIIKGKSSSTAINTGNDVFYVYGNGNVQNSNNSYSQISDVKLKENIVDANSQWNDLKAVQVRNFNFKAETGYSTHTQIGVVAQEIEAVSPGLVYETPDRDAEGEDLGTVTKAVSYSVLYMKAIKALQEAMTRIETLETKVAALEAG